MTFLVWLSSAVASVASHPLMTRILVPAVMGAVSRKLDELALKYELKAAVKQAKAAQTAQELRDASRRLSDSTRR